VSFDAGDRLAVAELLARYAEAMDAGDFAAVGALLQHATIADQDGNPIAQGAEQVEALYTSTTRRHDDGTPRTAHVITNVIVDPDGEDRAEVRSRFTVLQATETLALQPVVVGRYVDAVERRDGTWCFVHRRMIPEAWGDVGEHLTFQPRR
jgi:3-phenylpropionate/cinnamic acid dioxygenase small subunit